MLKITKENIEKFAEEMFQFNCYHEYNPMCFSVSDILREQRAFQVTDMILNELDKAGFNMQSIKTFKLHGWKVDDFTSPVLEEPVLLMKNEEYENYFMNKGIIIFNS